MSRWLPDILRGDRGRPGISSYAQLISYFAANSSVPAWYLDAVNGDDSNAGTSAASALKTLEELSLRLAVPILTAVSRTVYLAQGTYGSLAFMAAISGASTKITVSGAPLVVASGPLGSYAALSHAAKTSTQITVTDLDDLSPYVGMRVRRLSDNSVSFIGSVNPDGLGVGVARIAPPMVMGTLSVVAWFASDNVVIEQLPTVGTVAVDFLLEQADSSSRPLWIDSLNLTTKLMVDCKGQTCIVQGCNVSAKLSSYRSNYVRTSLYGSFFNPAKQGSSDVHALLSACVVKTSSSSLYTSVSLSRCLLIGTAVVVVGSDWVSIQDLQSFDGPASRALDVQSGAKVWLVNGMSCSNVYGVIRMSYNSRIKWGSSAGFTFGASYNSEGIRLQKLPYGSFTSAFDCLGTSAQIWAAASNYLDGYQSGTAVIGVGGFVDVVCTSPTDFTMQTVRVSCPSVTTIQPYAPVAERISFAYVPVNSLGSFRIYGEVGKSVDWEIGPTNHDIYFRTS